MYSNYYYRNGDRQFFIPFLLGGLAGSAVVGLSRPRPVYVNGPYPYYNNPYYYNNYGGYVPYR